MSMTVTDFFAVPLARPEDTTMAEEHEERRSGSDRRSESALRAPSPWVDPRLWLTAMGLLLTVALAVLGYIAAQLQSINTSVQATRDMVLQVTSRQTAEIAAMEDRIKNLESAMVTQTQAYNFNFTTRLAAVEAKAGIKQRED
jgi:hypothetical protein